MTTEFNKPLTDKELKVGFKSTLDILQALVVTNNFKRIAARAGWSIDLVFHEGDTLVVRERAWKVFEQYSQAVGPEQLVFWWGGMPSPLTSKHSQNRIAKHKPSTLENPSGFAMMFRMASGKPKPPEDWENNAQDFHFYCRIENEEGLRQYDRQTPGVGSAVSFIRMTLPVSWILSQPAERNVGWLSTRMVELMQPFWCTAGWGIVPAVEERNIDSDGKGQQYLYPYLQRFPGLNALGSLSMLGPKFNNAMFSVNWLSFVSDALLDRLGGREAVRKQIEDSKYLSAGDVGNCLGIRAGGFPALGDTERGIELPAFGEAARLLKPVRVKEMLNNFVAPPPAGSSDRDAQRLAGDAYLGRFDNY